MSVAVMVDLADIKERTKTVREYIDGLDKKNHEVFMKMYNGYSLDGTAVDEMKDLIQDLTLVIFSAAWCGDCKRAMPVMLQLEEKLGMDVRVFSDIKTKPLDPNVQWSIPPSPQEMDDWKVKAIPWFEFINKDGNRVAVLIEKPTVKDTLEAEIVYVLKTK
ncbi:MAG: TlpA family protein disulfide reductase [Candidatus Thorarchaeota archaeon]